ncbi:MAG TPA: Lrp/AsnC family transcriptional regulator [Pyrodictiaceae archaeon]|nr:Lrp/AsnC family transcriptional regulator [Pyrodictiaceae archaeon]HIQ11234.1 Lrp/AsnC family transcriptional regulator [Pyrodictium sp.]HIQ56060.1 Lrp/AsnC family transcriptional regulator [Pyrodictium sp.]
MPTAIILINTEVGADEEIFEKLKNIPEVKQIYMVYGLYDIVAVVESEDLNKLRDIVYNQVRSMPKVKSTLTMIVVKGLSKSKLG